MSQDIANSRTYGIVGPAVFCLLVEPGDRPVDLQSSIASRSVRGSPYGCAMTRVRTYTDERLVAAVTASKSWRGVLRELKLVASSSGAMRSVRAQADRLGLDYTNFVGQRRWTDTEIRAAIAEANSWTAVTACLDVESDAGLALVKGHAARIGADTTHLPTTTQASSTGALAPTLEHLDRAGPALAAAWYMLCGNDVSWPLEPSRYDLLVSTVSGIRRVQVKTTRTRAGDSWKVYLSTTRGGRRTYGPDEIDDFFIIDGDLNYYLIPVAVVGGLHAIHLNAYGQHRQTSLI
jgi:hypothetical protein